MWKHIHSYLRQFHWLVKLKRGLFALLRIDNRHAIFKDPEFHQKRIENNKSAYKDQSSITSNIYLNSSYGVSLLDLRNDKRHAIFRDPKFHQKRIENHKNPDSVDFKQGLVKGTYKDHSYVLKAAPRDYITSNIYLNGSWEISLLDLMTSFMERREGCFIDIGANIGATSIPLACVFQDRQFIAVEAHPDVYNDLVQNTTRNQLSNIACHQMAIANTDEPTIAFFAQDQDVNMGLSSTLKNDNISSFNEISVRAKKFDTLKSELSIEKISVMKIDVQGAELSVLESAKAAITKDRPIIFFEYEEEYHHEQAADERAKILQFFEALNYELYHVQPNENYYPLCTLEAYFHGDILALPK